MEKAVEMEVEMVVVGKEEEEKVVVSVLDLVGKVVEMVVVVKAVVV